MKTVKDILLVLLLAIVCIGGTELVVFRIVDPSGYARFTEPFFSAVSQAAGSIRDAAVSLYEDAQEDLIEMQESLFTEPEEPIEELQFASSPELFSDRAAEDSVVTHFETRGTVEILTGATVEVKYFNQTDDVWAAFSYGDDSMAGYACGPAAMSIVVSSLTENIVDLAAMADLSVERGHWANGQGSALSIVPDLGSYYGLTVEAQPEPWDAATLRAELAAGNMFVALMTNGHFTSSGHFIVLRGVTLDGRILVADPASRERSLVSWEADLILSELSASRSHGAPLWRIHGNVALEDST